LGQQGYTNRYLKIKIKSNPFVENNYLYLQKGHTNSKRPQDFIYLFIYVQICDIEHLVTIFFKNEKLVEFKLEKKSRNNPNFFFFQ
jgi:hypothetical protein